MVRLHDLPVILGLSAAASAYLFYEDYSSTCIIIGTVAIGVKALIHGFFPIPKLSPLPGPRINFDIGIQHVKGVVGKHPPLSVFYPAEKSQSHSKQVYSWVPYGDRRYIDGLAHFIGIPSFVLNHMNGVKIMATINAKRASGKQKFIVFSHGLGGHQHMYSVLAMELVSQGYTVVCPQHLDGSACFALCHEDNLVHYRRPNTKDDKELKRIRQNQLEHRVQEIQEILENYVPKSESVILVGHSFGAATATAAGWSEELRNRVKKIVALDLWCYPLPDRLVQCPATSELMTKNLPPLSLLESEQWEKWSENKTIEEDLMARWPKSTRSARMGTDHQSASDVGLMIPKFLRKKYVHGNDSIHIQAWAQSILMD